MSKKSNRIISRVVVGLLAIFAFMQINRIDKSVPETDKSKDFLVMTNAPENIKTMVKASCYDCHSFETRYPWYSDVAPVSWLLGNHITEGRSHLNFSVWGDYGKSKAIHKLEESAEEVEEKKMPLSGYVALHGDAKLSDSERESLAAWFKEQMQVAVDSLTRAD